MTPTSIEGASATLSELFQTAISKFGDHIAFRQGGSIWTYAEVGEMAGTFSESLRSQSGVKKGDRIALMVPNSIEFVVTAIAVIWAGGVLVNVNPYYTERELAHQLNDADVEIIIVGPSSTTTLGAVLDRTKIKTVIFSGGAERPRDNAAFTNVTTVNFQDALALANDTALEPVVCKTDDIAVLQYTGGTTGFPKGAILRHRNIASNSQQVKMALTPPLRPGEEIVLTALPLYHIFAFTVNFVTFFSLGATNNLIADPSDVEGLVQVMSTYPITAMTGVNTLYANIISSKNAASIDWSNFKVAIGGGSAILPITSAKWKALSGAHILEGYGMTETSPVMTVVPVDVEEFTATVGPGLPHTDIKIFDDDDNLLEQGQAGEICVRGPQVMSGYWKLDDLKDTVFNRHGYLRTGDIGFYDERGFIKIEDRKKDLILVSGFNVYPNEVEAVAASFALVDECACIGVPDESTAEAVKLFVVTSKPSEFSAADLRRHCRRQMAAYKVPKIVELVDALPKSTVGKILRRELKRMELAGAKGG